MDRPFEVEYTPHADPSLPARRRAPRLRRELFSRVADDCLQLFGGYGYMADYPISRFWSGARVRRLCGGLHTAGSLRYACFFLDFLPLLKDTQ